MDKRQHVASTRSEEAASGWSIGRLIELLDNAIDRIGSQLAASGSPLEWHSGDIHDQSSLPGRHTGGRRRLHAPASASDHDDHEVDMHFGPQL